VKRKIPALQEFSLSSILSSRTRSHHTRGTRGHSIRNNKNAANQLHRTSLDDWTERSSSLLALPGAGSPASRPPG
jgi:hypothetical protein